MWIFSGFADLFILKLCAEMPNLTVKVVNFGIWARKIKGDGKALCEILTVADSVPLPMADSRVGLKLPRHDSVRPSPWRGGDRIRSRLFGVLDPAHS